MEFMVNQEGRDCKLGIPWERRWSLLFPDEMDEQSWKKVIEFSAEPVFFSLFSIERFCFSPEEKQKRFIAFETTRKFCFFRFEFSAGSTLAQDERPPC